MQNLINVEKITKSYGVRKLFAESSFYLNEGEKVGMIGINGTGKSTLLRIIAGLEEPDEGTVTRARNLVIRFLPQVPELDPEDTVLGVVMKYHRTDANQAHLEADAKSLLLELGMGDYDFPIGRLSGGQKKKVALAALFAADADILILDEPTNHLDIDMAAWLENRLRAFRGSIVMVTHDRYFLDSVSNRIVEISQGNIYSYQTNYSGYLELKTQREEMALAGERKRQSILRTELAWVQRGAQARSTKQKARLERYEELKGRSGPQGDRAAQMSSVSTRLGRTTVELSHICKSYGERRLIDDFSYIFLKNDRVAFVGDNGCGKTTLMKIIEGRVTPDSGELEIGQTVKIGYYSQEIEMDQASAKEAGIAYMNPALRVIDYIKNTAEYIKTEEGVITASQMLERFLFEGEEQYGQIGKLSGGEKRRLNLLRVLMEAPNVLILDEPTNDLDITTLAILEDYLDHFDGIVVFVSHDRYFLDRLAKRIFAFEGNGKIVQYEGGYTDYQIRREYEAKEAADRNAGAGAKGTGGVSGVQRGAGKDAAGAADAACADGRPGASATWGHEKKLKFSYKEQKEYETIEQDIEQLEEELEQLDRDMLACTSDFIRLTQLTQDKEKTQTALEEKMDRWLYLEDLAAQIEAQGK